ncbi:N-acetylmuramoyl-L-alanine amidase [Robertmurraya siralis]|uniref:N-acetylmuramoyl-L-alanine amidase n=1 Tax=Robertmurraya siralis TaxID=77777 RepID=UPI0010F8669D|nr:N-acetylmuramoyl-L-alanine amidase [Robertmurraya siralis]
MLKIFIDPGHGGTDPGAMANGLLEKYLTLAISLKIKSLLSQYENVQVKLSRETDKYLSLSARAKLANAWGADYFMSIHINAGGGTGFETFIHTNASNASVANQNVIHPEILIPLGFKDRGKKRANYLVLRETKMPTILTENGFIDNASDAAKLKQTDFIDKIAQGHVNGLVKAFGLKKKAQSTQPKKQPNTPERKLSGMKPNWKDWQWKEAAEIYKKARVKGILSSDEWEKKAAAKNLTFDEIEYLNLVLNGRLL